MSTRAVARQPPPTAQKGAKQPPPAAQNPLIEEEHRSEDDENGLAAQNLLIQEEHRSEDDENRPAAHNLPTQEEHRLEDNESGLDTPITQSQQNKPPLITDDTTPESLPSSQESSLKHRNLEGNETDMDTVQEMIST